MSENLTTIFDRLDFLIENQNLNVSSFAKKIGIGDQTVRNIVANRRNEPSYKVIFAISQTFDWLSLEWLILGEGEMIKENTKSELTNNDSQQINRLLGIIESQQRQAESQQRVIENLSKKTVAPRDEPASSAAAV